MAKGEKREGNWNNVWGNKEQIFSKFDENCKATVQRILMNSKSKKYEKNYTKHIITKLFKTSYKEKILKAAKDQRQCQAWWSKDKEDMRFLPGSNASETSVEEQL